MTDFDIDVTPAVVWEQLEVFNDDFYESKLSLEQNLDKKCFLLEQSNAENEEDNLKIKIKFLDLKEENEDGEDVPSRLRVRFIKKRGNLTSWYKLFDKIKELALEDILLATRPQHEEIQI